MQTQEKTIPADPFAPELQPLSLVEVPAKPVVPAQQHSARVITPGDLLRIAMEAGDRDLDRLERLMQMDREYRAAKAKEAFDEDFAKFTELGLVVPKTRHVKQRAKNGGPGPSFWQSEYDHVSAMLKPPLGRLGFGVHIDPVVERRGNKVEFVKVTCVLTHRMGHSRAVTMEAPPDDSGSKNPMQEVQSSVTFLSRHALLAVTGTAQEGKDNDGRGARGYAEDAGGETDPERQEQASSQTQVLLDEGHKKAAEGTKAILKWWADLTDQQRSLVMPHFGAIKTEARKHDGGAK